MSHPYQCSHIQPRGPGFQVWKIKIHSGEKLFIPRIHLRNEFMRVGLIDVLDALEDDNSDELQTQLKVT